MPDNILLQQLEAPNFERLFPLYEFQAATDAERITQEAEYESLRGVVDYGAIEQRAWQLVAQHSRPQKRLAFNEAEDNARTALFEALTQSGHVSRIELEGDPELVHAQIIERLLNGYDPELPEHELRRRFMELCEELVDYEVFQKVVVGELPESTRTYASSDFPVGLGERANKLGYRYMNQKGMLREKSLMKKEGKYVRVIEQISRSNAHPDETIAALHEMGITVKRERAADIDVLGTHFMRTIDGAGEGLVGLMKRLDNFKGPHIMYGEIKTADTVSYKDVARISQEREQRVELFVKRLADTERTLDQLEQSGQITYKEWLRQYRQEVVECVRQICIINPEYAEGVLGGGVVKEAYLKAHEQFMSGDVSGASETIGSVASQENTIVICGGESESAQQANSLNNNDAQSIMAKKRNNSKEKWEWKKGFCRVELCAFQRKKTDVGPCNVCVSCQEYFDGKKDPTTEYRKQQLEAARAVIGKPASSPEKAERRVSKRDLIRAQYGEYAGTRTKLTIGGAKEVVVDIRSGYELAA
ncbi:hypothetical protein EYC58_02525 [Candidatus Saccharibacteria bacterium]|nr:MAG: hypothetical protein EYC58_02525 [Candidatus Saccharibacteria bacterium]